MLRDGWEQYFDRPLLEGIARRYGLLLVVLFGSFAKGRATDHSDVDVAVLAERHPWDDPDWGFGLEADLCRAFRDREADLTVLNAASAMLRFEVARTGISIIEAAPGAFTRFRSYAARAWYDEELRRHRQADYLARRRG